MVKLRKVPDKTLSYFFRYDMSIWSFLNQLSLKVIEKFTDLRRVGEYKGL